jgi:hypothetical protein
LAVISRFLEDSTGPNFAIRLFSPGFDRDESDNHPIQWVRIILTVGRTSIAAILGIFECPSPVGWCDLNVTPPDKWNLRLLLAGLDRRIKKQTGVPSYAHQRFTRWVWWAKQVLIGFTQRWKNQLIFDSKHKF